MLEFSDMYDMPVWIEPSLVAAIMDGHGPGRTTIVYSGGSSDVHGKPSDVAARVADAMRPHTHDRAVVDTLTE